MRVEELPSLLGTRSRPAPMAERVRNTHSQAGDYRVTAVVAVDAAASAAGLPRRRVPVAPWIAVTSGGVRAW